MSVSQFIADDRLHTFILMLQGLGLLGAVALVVVLFAWFMDHMTRMEELRKEGESL